MPAPQVSQGCTIRVLLERLIEVNAGICYGAGSGSGVVDLLRKSCSRCLPWSLSRRLRHCGLHVRGLADGVVLEMLLTLFTALLFV